MEEVAWGKQVVLTEILLWMIPHGQKQLLRMLVMEAFWGLQNFEVITLFMTRGVPNSSISMVGTSPPLRPELCAHSAGARTCCEDARPREDGGFSVTAPNEECSVTMANSAAM